MLSVDAVARRWREVTNIAYSLLGAHVNTAVGGLAEALSDWKPPLVVTLDHSDVWHRVKAASPRTLFVGRYYQAHEPDFNDPALDPLRAARDHCEKTLPWADRMGSTYRFWQGVNEPVIGSREAMARYADFDAERARLMSDRGHRVAVGSFAVGNPGNMSFWAAFLPALEAARQFDGALALHEYAWPSLDRHSPWYVLRHRKVYGGEPRQKWAGLPFHLQSLPLLITECGLDGLITQGDHPRGWQVLYDRGPDRYLRQLAWFDEELQKDFYVIGAAIYCCSAADFRWSTYDIWPDLAKVLAGGADPLYRFYLRPLPEELRRPALPAPTAPATEPAGTVAQSVAPAEPAAFTEGAGSAAPRAAAAGSDPIGPSFAGTASASAAASVRDEARLAGVLERLDRIIERLQGAP